MAKKILLLVIIGVICGLSYLYVNNVLLPSEDTMVICNSGNDNIDQNLITGI